MPDRPSWDQVWILVAQTVAQRSLCSRAQVGSVIVTADNRVASVSFNGAPDAVDCHGRPCIEWCARAKNQDSDPSYETCAANHAEANALLRANWTDIQGGTIYTSSGTCINCAKLVLGAGIKRVVHIVDPSQAYRGPEAVEAYLRGNGVEVVRC